jgi:hypothetical protein
MRHSIFTRTAIAHDKGKPAARQGRKAKSLPAQVSPEALGESGAEMVWLPKAIEESLTSQALGGCAAG